MLISIQDKLPPVYHHLFVDLVAKPIPQETLATCHDCVLCQPKDSTFVGTKCCTYYPFLTNYLIGGLLSDNDHTLLEGQKRVEAIIATKRGVTPFGVLNPLNYELLDKRIRDSAQRPTDLWSANEVSSLRCPYYDKGHCSVWKYREHCCVTHFCVSVGGQEGNNFWTAFDDYLKYVEYSLSKYAMLQMGWDASQIPLETPTAESLRFENAVGEVIENNYMQMWGEWYGREIEFYKETYRIINALTAEQFENITGVNQAILKKRVLATQHTFTHPSFPKYLKFNSNSILKPLENGDYHVSTDKVNFIVDEMVVRILKKFDGNKSTESICQNIKPLGLEFEIQYLKPLLQADVLIAI